MGDSCTQGTDNCHEPVARNGSQSEHLSQSGKVSTWGMFYEDLEWAPQGKMPAQKLWALWEITAMLFSLILCLILLLIDTSPIFKTHTSRAEFSNMKNSAGKK